MEQKSYINGIMEQIGYIKFFKDSQKKEILIQNEIFKQYLQKRGATPFIITRDKKDHLLAIFVDNHYISSNHNQLSHYEIITKMLGKTKSGEPALMNAAKSIVDAIYRPNEYYISILETDRRFSEYDLGSITLAAIEDLALENGITKINVKSIKEVKKYAATGDCYDSNLRFYSKNGYELIEPSNFDDRGFVYYSHPMAKTNLKFTDLSFGLLRKNPYLPKNDPRFLLKPYEANSMRDSSMIRLDPSMENNFIQAKFKPNKTSTAALTELLNKTPSSLETDESQMQ